MPASTFTIFSDVNSSVTLKAWTGKEMRVLTVNDKEASVRYAL
jgi:hypothetical protein